MIELSRLVAEGSMDLEALEAFPDDVAIARLQHLRGVGRWTAEYVLLRGLGRIHVFPAMTLEPATTCRNGSACGNRSITTASAARSVVGNVSVV